MTTLNKKLVLSAAATSLAALSVLGVAEASTAGGTFATAFDDVYTDFSEIIENSLIVKFLSFLLVIGSIAIGVARQSLMPIAIGSCAGIGLNQAPTVIDQMFTTTQAGAIDMQIVGANLGLLP